MTEKKVRIMFFTLGLAVGIILGASVVKVYSDKVNAETSVSKNFVSRLFGNIIGLVYKPKPSKSDSLSPKNTRNFNINAWNQIDYVGIFNKYRVKKQKFYNSGVYIIENMPN